jgi:secretion/DNA translocation related TadE-like protein
VSPRAEGSATVWALIAVLVIWAATAVSVVEVAAVQIRHRVAAAADAGALAAAAEGGLDSSRACAAARAAAGRVGAVLISCRMTGPYAAVAVRMSPPAGLAWAGAVTARARAGPADTGKQEVSAPSRTAS